MAASPNGPRSLPAVWLAAVASKYEHEPVLVLLVSGRERTVLDHARQESMSCNEEPCKRYTNPWSQNKLGRKTIIGKAACSQRAGLGWGREACFLYSSTYLRPNMWLPTPHYSDQKNIHNSSPCSKKDKYSSYFTPKKIRSISNLEPKENNPYLSSRITAI